MDPKILLEFLHSLASYLFFSFSFFFRGRGGGGAGDGQTPSHTLTCIEWITNHYVTNEHISSTLHIHYTQWILVMLTFNMPRFNVWNSDLYMNHFHGSGLRVVMAYLSLSNFKVRGDLSMEWTDACLSTFSWTGSRVMKNEKKARDANSAKIYSKNGLTVSLNNNTLMTALNSFLLQGEQLSRNSCHKNFFYIISKIQTWGIEKVTVDARHHKTEFEVVQPQT